MAYFHGVKTRQIQTSISTPVTSSSGITFAVGTAPVHINGGKRPEGGGQLEFSGVNVPVMGMNNAEAVTQLGYSDNWDKYSLCEVMYNHYRLFAIRPVFFVNVLDPAKHKKTVAAANFPVIEGRVTLPFEAVAETVTVQNFNAGEDFEIFYDADGLIIEILENGAITPDTAELSVTFDEVDPTQVTKADIIGEFDVISKKTTGFELIEQVFPRFGIVPDILIAPGFSHDAEVAAVMTRKAESINGVFEAVAIIDVDTKEVKHYADAPAWKKKQNINDKRQVLVYPKFRLAERVFHASTQAAALMGRTDTRNNGAPSESPSNKLLQMNAAVLDDGTEVVLDIQQANYLNSQGIVTALNFIGGFVLWGNETACFPANTDVKDYFIPVSRMFGWVSNSLILTYWNQVDRKISRRFIESVVDSVNIWLNGLMAEEHILGGRVEFREDDNPETAIMSGKATFHIFITPPSPAREVEFVLEYDPSYVTAALM